MRFRRLKRIPMRIPIGAFLLLGVGLSAQVHLDVVVRDSHSRIVRNLEAADFSVRENGAEAAIRTVQPADPKQKHLVSLLFDHLGGEPARLAREAAMELLNAAAKSNVAFGVFESDPALRARQPFTADAKAVRRAIEQATSSKPAAGAAQPSEDAVTQRVLRAAKAVESETRTRPAVIALMALIRGSSPEPGRKAIVYFSQGLPVDPRRDGFRVIISSANRAGVAVYAIDAAALAISHDEEVRRAAALQSMIKFGEERPTHEVPGSGAPTTIYQQTAVTADRLDRRNPANTPPSALAVLTRSTGGFLLETGTGFRQGMRRVAEELTGYYEITYLPKDREPDGAFRATRVEVKLQKSEVRGREGYFATPDLSGRPVLPYEIPLLGAIERSASSPDLSHRAAVLHFRDDAGRAAATVALEVPTRDLQFQQDDSAGVFRARVAVLALVRAADGTVVDRLGGDTPILSPRGMLDDMRRRFVSMQKQMDLPPGAYVLETAVQDRIGEHVSTSRREFTVAAPAAGLGLSSVTVVRAVTPSAGEEHDAGFHLDDKNVEPALDGGAIRGHPASVYFKVYPDSGAAGPVDVALELWSGDKRAIHSASKITPDGAKPLAEVLTLDVSRVPAGTYELRVTARQGGSRAVESASLVIPAGGEESASALPDDSEVPVETAATPKAVPPTAEQQRLIETARENALRYSERLPNFICTQATRRMIDAGGKGEWRTVEEASDLLSFYDGREHYAPLTMQAKTKEGDFPASVNSAGEFGSIMKEVFDPASAASFAWLRREQVRGRVVQVFSYFVDAAHSRYRITYRGSQQQAPVFAAFRGQVALDPETGTVRRLTLSTEPQPANIPVRQVSLALDYDEIGVADQVYLLPVAVTLDVRLHKKTVARNEVSFRSYQRFSADSRITFQPR
jgi:VWFA-related protein